MKEAEGFLKSQHCSSKTGGALTRMTGRQPVGSPGPESARPLGVASDDEDLLFAGSGRAQAHRAVGQRPGRRSLLLHVSSQSATMLGTERPARCPEALGRDARRHRVGLSSCRR